MLYFSFVYFYYFLFLYIFLYITYFSLKLLDFKKFFKYFITFYSADNFAFTRSAVTPTYKPLQNPRASSREITDGGLIPSPNSVDRGKTNLLESTVHSAIISHHLDYNSRERRRRLSLFTEEIARITLRARANLIAAGVRAKRRVSAYTTHAYRLLLPGGSGSRACIQHGEFSDRRWRLLIRVVETSCMTQSPNETFEWISHVDNDVTIVRPCIQRLKKIRS